MNSLRREMLGHGGLGQHVGSGSVIAAASASGATASVAKDSLRDGSQRCSQRSAATNSDFRNRFLESVPSVSRDGLPGFRPLHCPGCSLQVGRGTLTLFQSRPLSKLASGVISHTARQCSECISSVSCTVSCFEYTNGTRSILGGFIW